MFIFHIISVNIYDMRKKTHEKFIEEMKNKNPNIEILGTYVGAQTKIKCKCLIDGYIWDVKPANLLSGRGCPKCKANKLKKTHKEFIEELKAKNPNIDILGEYINNKTKIKCKCLIDGHIWEPTPETILRGQGCPKCAGTLKKTHEEFIEEIKNINPNIEILGKYINARTKIKCRCLIDNWVWYVMPYSILSKYGCPKCGVNSRANKRRKSHEEFIEEMEVKNTNIKILGEYKSAHTKVKCRCLIDEHTWDATPDSLLRGNGCPKCGINSRADKFRKTYEEFIEEIKTKNSKIAILGEYINNQTKIKCKCLIDEHIWEALHSNLLKGKGCPKCNSSKGETIIEHYCKKNYLRYIIQYKIDKCRNKYSLPFDFALFNKNKLVALIEYQGEQHYKAFEHFGGEKRFKQQQINDQIKRDYCTTNNIPLIEIPYWIEDIETYLEEQLNKINKPLQLSFE